MDIQILHDRSVIFAFLKGNVELQTYCIGDLDDFFWPKTIWYALVDRDEILAIALLYAGMETPTLLSFYDGAPTYSRELLSRIRPILPNKFYAHLSPGLVEVFGQQHVTAHYGMNYKMVLHKQPLEIDDSNIRLLTVVDLPMIQDFYSVAYPDNWFDKRMLETNKYYGYVTGDRLVGVAGVHVYSGDYKVAALGNIATHPEHRGQQIGYKLTLKLCVDLRKTVDAIGLNVRSNNGIAINCYEKIGFDIIGEYEECLIENA